MFTFRRMVKRLCSAVDNKVFRIVESFDMQISHNLKVSHIETRPVKSHGLWCCTLIPAILMLYSYLYPVSQYYRLMAYISIGLFIYSLLFITFMSVSSIPLESNMYGGIITSGVISSLLINSFLKEDVILTLFLTMISGLLYNKLLQVSLYTLRKTFTMGEAMVVSQGITLLAVGMTLTNFGKYKQDEETVFISKIVYTVFSTVGLIVTALYLLRDKERSFSLLMEVIAGSALFCFILLHILLGPNCILEIFTYIFLDSKKMKLFTLWLLLVVISICLVCIRTFLSIKANTVTRKYFHLLASLVFVSGITQELNFMKLAAGVGFSVLILVEAIRKFDFDRISSRLDAAFMIYCDEKDSGMLAMTPMYLFVGLACPLVLVPDSNNVLELLSGVLAIGVGDTAASWYGTKYGVNKWAGSDRTVEGTLCNIVTQVATIYVLMFFKLIHANYAIVRAVVAATISALVEARIQQVDNLILPLVTIMAFQATSFLK